MMTEKQIQKTLLETVLDLTLEIKELKEGKAEARAKEAEARAEEAEARAEEAEARTEDEREKFLACLRGMHKEMNQRLGDVDKRVKEVETRIKLEDAKNKEIHEQADLFFGKDYDWGFGKEATPPPTDTKKRKRTPPEEQAPATTQQAPKQPATPPNKKSKKQPKKQPKPPPKTPPKKQHKKKPKKTTKPVKPRFGFKGYRKNRDVILSKGRLKKGVFSISAATLEAIPYGKGKKMTPMMAKTAFSRCNHMERGTKWFSFMKEASNDTKMLYWKVIMSS